MGADDPPWGPYTKPWVEMWSHACYVSPPGALRCPGRGIDREWIWLTVTPGFPVVRQRFDVLRATTFQARVLFARSTFVTELMTGFIGGGSNPMSTVTIQSLLDMGYEVDVSQADPYTLGDPNSAPNSETKIYLMDDILRMPIKMVDKNGRIIKVVNR